MIPFLKNTKYFFVLILMSFIAGCSSDNDDNLPAVEAAFTYFIDGTTGTVEFTNTSTNANSYFWDLGNGNTTTEENPTDTYTESGEYIITLEASNVSGGSNTITDTITINIAEPLTLALPINFDTEINLEGITTFDTSFQVIDNPNLSGVNDVASKVGEIKSNGVQYQGISFALDTPVDFSGTNKTIQLKLYSTVATDFVIKFSNGIDNARDNEVKVAHTGSGWELLNFDFATNAIKSYIDGTQGAGEAFVPTGQYGKLDLFVAFEGGEIADTFYVDDIMQTDSGGIDATAPVITLNGESTMNVTVGGTFTDQGATANDNVDGDISENIQVAGDTVDTNTAGTYVITYNVSDAAGNAAAEVTRTVVVAAESTFDDGLLTNGDFENGSTSWTLGVSTDSVPTVTEDGNTYMSIDVTAAGNSFDVNMSQVLALDQGSTYILTFDAWSSVDRSILAGIGLSVDPWTNKTETVNITTTRQTYTLTLAASDFGGENSRVIFDLGAEIGMVNIDNVSLFLDESGGGDTTAPVITLEGDATMNLTVGDTFTDPGATASDDTDGDISVNIEVAGDTVDTNTAGTYVITYNVSDAAGNAATEVIRTIIVVTASATGDYVYATTGTVTIASTISDWGSGTTIDSGYSGDTTYNPSIQLISGTGWGDVSAIAFTAIEEGKILNYSTLEFKIKTTDYTTIKVKMPGASIEEPQFTIANGINLTEGWVQMSIELSEFGTIPVGINEFAILEFGAGTILITDVMLSGVGSGGDGGTDPNAPTTAAPTPPTRDAADVVSLFSDVYSNITIDTWSADWDDSDIEDITVEGNNTKKISFGNFIGIDFQSSRFNASEMTHFHIDFWTSNTDLDGKVFNSKFSNWSGGAGETSAVELNINGGTTPPLTSGQWVSVDLALDSATNPTRDDLVQFLVTSNLGVVYVDNIYLYK